ncbi:MAG: hypothetical protein AAF399_27235, partial [Bacteroidota bacterium]
MQKSLLSLLLFLGLISVLQAQTPQAFNYQAVARDANEDCIADQVVSLRFNILDQTAAGTILYTELQSATTNQQGLFSVEIGRGQVLAGVYTQLHDIPWSQDPKFLQVEMDALGGSNYQLIGSFELLSVPYAFTSEEAATSDSALFADTAA